MLLVQLVRLPFEICRIPYVVTILQDTHCSHFAVRQTNDCPIYQLNSSIDNELRRFVRNQSNRAVVSPVIEIDRNCEVGNDVKFLLVAMGLATLACIVILGSCPDNFGSGSLLVHCLLTIQNLWSPTTT